jgi:threonine dehydrogenase-like Zn-dependent dehydrogenase
MEQRARSERAGTAVRTGRAVVMVGKEFVIREYEVPDPAPGTVLLRQELAGICGTDLHNWEFSRLQGEILLGHENVGIVERLGDGVDSDYLGQPIKPGDRVVFAPGTPTGAYGFFDAEEAPHFRGGFADYIYLAQPSTCIVKTSLPAEAAVLSEPFQVGVHGVLRSKLMFGDTVVIQGSGAIGLMTLIAAKLSGAGRLIVVGGPAGRLEKAKMLGADVVIDIGQVRDPAERTKIVREHTAKQRGADVVFECAGFLPAINEGLGYVRYGGTFVEMGHFVDIGSLQLNPNQELMRRNLRLEAVWGGGSPDYFVRAHQVMSRGEVPFQALVDPILPLERVAEGFDALHNGYKLGGKDVLKVAVKGALA